ncbi:unnamed protein product [Protopolystoma xenopodis]|uniref:carnosine N-methyltransferase n=1 Tax=Protopolystoma xenopodis TaxID=117903 RepID=A0A448WYJ6_9PLAT|nr:unnamed protein product [Protopolystoma xenopodis]
MLHRLKIGSDYYSRLPESQKKLVNEYPDTVEKIKSCIIHNSELISKVLRNISSNIFDDHPFSFDQGKAINGTDKEASIINNPYGVTSGDMDKVRSTLKQFVRDWSSEGQAERDSCYKPVLNELVDIYKEKDRSTLHILVPGAGLGRLAWEIAHLGFNCQGNEFSLHMLLPAYFILNSCRNIDSYTLYPWVSQSCNILSRKDQLASVRFPDVSPSDLPKNIQFSMAAGDFLEVYSEKGLVLIFLVLIFSDYICSIPFPLQVPLILLCDSMAHKT